MSTNEEVLNLLKELYGTVEGYDKRCFLLPDGSFVRCPDNFGGLQHSHSSVTYRIVQELKDRGNTDVSITPLEDAGCIHLNGEKENYIFLTETKPTKEQRYKLVEWINDFFEAKHFKEPLRVLTPDHKQMVSYSPMENDGNTIVSKINRFYNTGALYEDTTSETKPIKEKRYKVVKWINDLFVLEIAEGGLSRIWSHSTDYSTFAIIGSMDKDTKEDRSDELILEISKVAGKSIGKIGYKYLFGRYKFEDGSFAEELSIIVFNIDKQSALNIANNLNQESIIWKDDIFFGILASDGTEVERFVNDPQNMNLSAEDIKHVGSRLAKRENKNGLKWFKFSVEQYKPLKQDVSSIRNMAYDGKPREKETIFEVYRV